jgi:hypothetical protein
MKKKTYLNRNPFQQLEEERKEAELRLEKMKNEMEGVFDLKVKEKITRLKESEQNVNFFFQTCDSFNICLFIFLFFLARKTTRSNENLTRERGKGS